MKKLLFTMVLLLSTACSNIIFDGLQYDRYVFLIEDATTLQTKCGSPEMKDELAVFRKNTDHMNAYATFRSNSPEVLAVTYKLSSMVSDLESKYTNGEPSVAYCKEKLNNIAAGAKTVAATLGAQ
jgi:hypothetical protein